MKKLILLFCVVLSTNANATNMFFSADSVENAIVEFVSPELQTSVATAYETYMNAETGEISDASFVNVCNVGGLNAEQCTEFATSMITNTTASADYRCNAQVSEYNKRVSQPFNQVLRSTSDCNKLSGTEKSRCNKCVNHAGSYEKGRCYIEVLHYFCQSGKNGAYSGCGLRRKNVNVEMNFTCPKNESLWAFSGCCQHGWSHSDKHAPINIYGGQNNCKLPLAENTDWRVGGKFVTDETTKLGEGTGPGRNWNMPLPTSTPWARDGRNSFAHCNPKGIVPSGQTVVFYNDLND